MADLKSIKSPRARIKFGRTNLYLSPIVIECKLLKMKTVDTFQEKNKEELLSMLKYCYDRGLRTFDANEDNSVVVGEFLQKYGINRRHVIIISKMDIPTPYDLEFIEAKDANLIEQEGYLRNYIFKNVKGLLNGVGTYIDIFQIGNFDPDLPKGEVLSALNELIIRSEILYTTAHPMSISQFTEWEQIAERYHSAKFIGWKLDYNLLNTTEEKGKIEFSKKKKIGLISWVPSDGGLGRKIVESIRDPPASQRLSNSLDLRNLGLAQQEAYHSLQALSRSKQKPGAAIVAARALSVGCFPVVGCSSIKDVDQALMALQTYLSPEDFNILGVRLD